MRANWHDPIWRHDKMFGATRKMNTRRSLPRRAFSPLCFHNLSSHRMAEAQPICRLPDKPLFAFAYMAASTAVRGRAWHGVCSISPEPAATDWLSRFGELGCLPLPKTIPHFAAPRGYGGLMKSLIVSLVAGSLSLAVSGAMVGCSASGSIEPDHTSTTSGSSSSYKKTEVRDANGNLIEKKVETKSAN
jgi:hypothetical protein